MRIVLLELIREAECHDRKSCIVIRARFILFREHGVFDAFEAEFTLLAMNVADADIPPCCFQSFAEKSSVGEAVLHDLAISIEAKVDEVVILGDYLCARAGEIESVGLFSATFVVRLERYWKGLEEDTEPR
jgi:hypothetical protein